MSVSVKYLDGKKFEVACRGHSIIVDQPESEDGTDKGMTPVELLNASVSACAAFYALLYLKRRIKDLNDLEVKASWEYSENPHRIGT
ncbi:MAG: putative redox protein [Thermoproteota archaeon]|nr:putative redox protein [Thermoproteota archaeon]